MSDGRWHDGWRWAAIACLTIVATAHAVNIADPFGMDFVSFYAAGRLALAGTAADAWNLARHQAMELTAVAERMGMPFPYPPFFLFLVTPFALLPFGGAALAWTVATLAALLAAWRALMPGAVRLAMAFPPVVAAGVIAQNGLLSAALMGGGVALLARRPWVAGVLFGALAYKPQLGLAIPLALLAVAAWRSIAAAVLTLAALSLASLALFGPAAWTGFVELLPLYGRIATQDLVGWQKMASLYALARAGGVPDPLAWAIHVAGAAAAVALMLRTWRTTDDPLARAGTLGIASAAISPYLYLYDQAILLPAVGHLLARGMRQRTAALLYAVPALAFAMIATEAGRLPAAPLLTLALLALAWRQHLAATHRDGPRRLRTAPAAG